MRRFVSWLVAFVLIARWVLLAAPIAATFVIVTALSAGGVEDLRWRVAIGVGASLVLPLLLRWRLGEFLRTRKKPAQAPAWATFVALMNATVAAVLAFGFADDVGRALRRHGDWFCGESNGAVVRNVRGSVGAIAGYLERFDPPRELAPVVIPPDPTRIPDGPWRPGETPPEALPTVVGWFHPLAGPRRAMPLTESRRFGAVRPQPRPEECELGHCGVDLGTTLGEPVFAIFDGIVERIERDEARGANAGRYIRIGHKDATVVSRYIHLDSIRDDLREGARVRGGELIGRLGRTGVEHSGAHLHFSVSLRPAGRSGGEHYIDPEPMLRDWQLPSLTAGQQAVASR
jgi:murein DD-endopeptidase MepM/ murein hydrolase activator NlpD